VTLLERAFERQSIDDECSRALSAIDNELRRLSKLVTEFFEFAQPQRIAPGPVPLRSLIDRVARRMVLQLERAGVSLEVEVHDLVVEVDRLKLERALEELLVNAIEASPRGDFVVLRTHAAAHDIIVEVEDHGAGFPDVTLPVFDPFVSTKASGTGLGLAIARRMVTDMAGTVVFETQPGRTLFRIAVPREPRPLRPTEQSRTR
jgi:signal transduction histidine kinase